jgi:hypothetical protein
VTPETVNWSAEEPRCNIAHPNTRQRVTRFDERREQARKEAESRTTVPAE